MSSEDNIREAHLTADYKIESSSEEEERPQATEQEEIEFGLYQRQLKKQEKVIDSYDKMLAEKSRREKKEQIKPLISKVSNRVMNLQCQGEEPDRLGITYTLYQNIVEAIKAEYLFDGDIEKQYRLLELLASQEYEVKPAVEVRTLLEQEFPELFP